MLSWASIITSFFWSAKFLMEGNLDEGAVGQIIVLGIRPKLRKNGAYPVLTDHAEFMANSIAGNFNTQYF